MLAFLDSGLMPVVDGDPIPLEADSICVHGDTPRAVAIAARLREALTSAGVTPTPFAATSER